MFGKKGSKILKLPPVRNCFTLTMTNKLVVIINSLKYQKLSKFYYMKLNFLNQITAASRTPDQGATAPRSQLFLFSTEFIEPPGKKFLGTPLVFSAIFHSKNNSATHYLKCIQVFIQTSRYSILFFGPCIFNNEDKINQKNAQINSG